MLRLRRGRRVARPAPHRSESLPWYTHRKDPYSPSFLPEPTTLPVLSHLRKEGRGSMIFGESYSRRVPADPLSPTPVDFRVTWGPGTG